MTKSRLRLCVNNYLTNPSATLNTTASTDRVCLIDRHTARDPAAAEETLERLARSKERHVRRAVASNPATPKATLLILARQFPLEVFRNSAFEWLLLEDPDLFGSLDDSVLTRILRHKDCPLSLMEWAVRKGPYCGLRFQRHQLAVAMNPSAPARLLRQLMKHKKEGFGLAVADAARLHEKVIGKHPLACPPSLEHILTAALGEIRPLAARAEWRKGNLSPCQWPFLSPAARLAIHADVWGLSHWSNYENLSEPVRCALPDYAQALAHLGDLPVRMALAECEKTPAEVLEDLATDSDEVVRVKVAANPSTPARLASDLIKLLATSSSDQNREHLVFNPRSPESVLDKLSRLRTCREYVAKNRSASAATLERLSRDPDPDVREAVAVNPSTPLSVLRLLAVDHKPAVRNAVAGNESATTEMIRELVQRHGLGEVYFEVAHNPAAPEILRQEAFNLLDEGSRRRLTQCSKGGAQSKFDAPGYAALQWFKAMRKSAKRRGWNLLDPVFSDASPTELIARHQRECSTVLLDPANSAIARLIGAGPRHLSVYLLPDGRTSPALRSEVRAVRLMGLCQPSVERSALIKFHRSLEWTERFAVAAHEAAPSGVLAALSKDPNRWVAARAAARYS